MKYDPQKHHRHSIRLKGYDYSNPGAYFVNLCAEGRELLFGDIVEGKMILNELGQMVDEYWHQTMGHFTGIKTDYYVVMPSLPWNCDDFGAKMRIKRGLLWGKSWLTSNTKPPN